MELLRRLRHILQTGLHENMKYLYFYYLRSQHYLHCVRTHTIITFSVRSFSFCLKHYRYHNSLPQDSDTKLAGFVALYTDPNRNMT